MKMESLGSLEDDFPPVDILIEKQYKFTESLAKNAICNWEKLNCSIENYPEEMEKNYESEFLAKIGRSVYKAPEQLSVMKNKLNNVRACLDDIDIAKWNKYTTEVNIEAKVISTIRKFCTPSGCELVTNGWVKMFEMLRRCSILPVEKLVKDAGEENKKITTLHLCECPGGFICATNHHVKSIDDSVELIWRGLSLNPYYEGIDPNMAITDDGFFCETSENWIVKPSNSGDIISSDTIKSVAHEMKKLKYAQLVSADGSVSSQHDPNNQELITAPLHFAECVCALRALRRGGNFVLKMFNLFEHHSISVLAIISLWFKNLSVVKPYLSRPGNGEVYVIGHHFLGISPTFCKCLSSFVGKELPLNEAIIPKEWMTERFLEQFVECAGIFADFQMHYINRNLSCWEDPKRPTNFYELTINRKNYVSYKFLKETRIKPIENKLIVLNPIAGTLLVGALAKTSKADVQWEFGASLEVREAEQKAFKDIQKKRFLSDLEPLKVQLRVKPLSLYKLEITAEQSAEFSSFFASSFSIKEEDASQDESAHKYAKKKKEASTESEYLAETAEDFPYFAGKEALKEGISTSFDESSKEADDRSKRDSFHQLMMNDEFKVKDEPMMSDGLEANNSFEDAVFGVRVKSEPNEMDEENVELLRSKARRRQGRELKDEEGLKTVEDAEKPLKYAIMKMVKNEGPSELLEYDAKLLLYLIGLLLKFPIDDQARTEMRMPAFTSLFESRFPSAAKFGLLTDKYCIILPFNEGGDNDGYEILDFATFTLKQKMSIDKQESTHNNEVKKWPVFAQEIEPARVTLSKYADFILMTKLTRLRLELKSSISPVIGPDIIEALPRSLAACRDLGKFHFDALRRRYDLMFCMKHLNRRSRASRGGCTYSRFCEITGSKNPHFVASWLLLEEGINGLVVLNQTSRCSDQAVTGKSDESHTSPAKKMLNQLSSSFKRRGFSFQSASIYLSELRHSKDSIGNFIIERLKPVLGGGNSKEEGTKSPQAASLDGETSSTRTHSTTAEPAVTSSRCDFAFVDILEDTLYHREIARLEIEVKHRLLVYMLEAMISLKKGADVVVRMSTIFTRYTAGIIQLISCAFSRVYIFRPMSCPPWTLERYVIFEGFNAGLNELSLASYMIHIYDKLESERKGLNTSLSCLQTIPPIYIGNSKFTEWLVRANNMLLQQEIDDCQQRLGQQASSSSSSSTRCDFISSLSISDAKKIVCELRSKPTAGIADFDQLEYKVEEKLLSFGDKHHSKAGSQNAIKSEVNVKVEASDNIGSVNDSPSSSSTKKESFRRRKTTTGVEFILDLIGGPDNDDDSKEEERAAEIRGKNGSPLSNVKRMNTEQNQPGNRELNYSLDSWNDAQFMPGPEVAEKDSEDDILWDYRLSTATWV